MPSPVVDPRGRERLSEYPALCAELDQDRNGPDVDPAEIRRGSGRRLWWRCAAGPDHVWLQRVSNRTRGGGCPFCAGVRVSVTNCLATRHPEIAAQWHPENPLEPTQVVAGSSMLAWFRCPHGPDHVWSARLFKRTLDGAGCPFCAGLAPSVTNSLAARFPMLVVEWHHGRNRGVRPTDVVAGSTRKVWWRCSRDAGHVWEASLHDRTVGGTGCPRCARLGQRPDDGRPTRVRRRSEPPLVP